MRVSCRMNWRVALAGSILCAAAVWAGDQEPWEQKPYTDWTLADVLKVTRDSPWARSLDNNATAPPPAETATKRKGYESDPNGKWVRSSKGSLIYVPQTTNVTPQNIPQDTTLPQGQKKLQDAVVLWASSETVRQALARMAALEQKPLAEQEKKLAPESLNFYKISVSSSHLPGMLLSYKGEIESALKNSTSLRANRSKQEFHPVRVDIVVEPPQPVVNFYFTRESNGAPIFGPGDQKVNFRWRSPNGEVEVTFDLRKMLHNGAPDL